MLEHAIDSSTTHIFPGCCFTSSTARIESASGVASSCCRPRGNTSGPTEWIGRPDDREEVVVLPELFERVREPLDVGDVDVASSDGRRNGMSAP